MLHRIKSLTIGVRKSLYIPKRQTPVSMSEKIRAAQTNSLNSRNKEEIKLKKQVPDKKDIQTYCRLDERFQEVDDEIKELIKKPSQKGLSALYRKRSNLKAEILNELPFGNILNRIESN